jgi:hypothetical protein
MAGTHDDGRLFGFDGVNMWTESTLDTVPPVDTEAKIVAIRAIPWGERTEHNQAELRSLLRHAPHMIIREARRGWKP